MRPVRFEDQGDWWLAYSAPHPALRPFLTAYNGYWEKGMVPSRMRTLPGRHAVMIVNLGSPLDLEVPGAPVERYSSFVAGMHDGHGSYHSPGGQRGVQLDLTPLGAYTLLGIPMGHLTNIAAALPDLLGRAAGELAARLDAAPGWPARFGLLDRFLLDRLEIGPSPSPEVTRAWQVLLATQGRAAVGDLAGDVGWSRRHLAQRFKEQVGLAPKVMARVLRFERAVELMAAGPPDLAGIAIGCGYFDQAHLNREVRALAGCTPTELLATLQPQSAESPPREYAGAGGGREGDPG
ncbi:helix-turn-helix domain-containing protein [Actinomadura sp. 9N407]|uniref:helix-turn-helix domain-containing protein n=1 Tax=Actinomadura sp. 9N407 TaxID=3375154 RepID=UPI0037A04677